MNERLTVMLPVSVLSESSPIQRATRFERRLAIILEHATAVFCEKGYEGASMRDLSRASGMSLAGLYYYFGSKEELLCLIQKSLYTQVMELLHERLNGVSDPEQRVRIFIANHIEYFLAKPKAMKVLSQEGVAMGAEMADEVGALKRQYDRDCADLIQALKQHKNLAYNARLAVMSLWGMINWPPTWYNARVDGSPQLLSREISDIFLRGIYSLTEP